MLAIPPPSADETLVILLRHGATANNEAHPPRLQGRRADPPLSAAGESQALACARCLAGVPLAAIYASPLVRARTTAEPTARQAGLEVRTVAALIEVDIGDCEGRTWEEMDRLAPEATRRFLADPAGHPYPGGESMTEVRERALPAVREIAARHPGGIVLIAAHNVVNRALLATALDLPLTFARRLPQHNGGLNLLRVRGGALKLLTLNSIAHLPKWE